jgi:hypothetical protein
MAQAKRKERSLSAVDDDGGSEPAPAQPTEPWKEPAALSRRGWYILGAVILLMNIPVLHLMFKSAPEAPLALPYRDDFSNKETVKTHYFTTGGLWRVIDGQLFSPGVKNNPLWLKAKLPRDVVIEFDAHSDSPEGDIRVELFGNGLDHLSGYELIQGAYNNSKSIIGRLDERLQDENGRPLTLGALQDRARRTAAELHLPNAGLKDSGLFGPNTHVVVEANPYPVTPKRVYHWRIERRGGVLRWDIDGQPFMQFDDPFPLEGPGHDRFGPSSWESDVYFDNLKVEALDASTAAAPFPSTPMPPNAPAVPSAPAALPPQNAVATAPLLSPAGALFQDKFDRAELGADWKATDPQAVTLDHGSLLIQNGHNHPVWLNKPLPESVVIDFDVWTDSPIGDMKIELFGDGHSFHQGDLHAAYTSSGYVFVMGGWNNTISAIAKQHEHGPERAVREDVKVEPGRHYHWRILRKGGQLGWLVDGKPFLGVNDPAPLTGADHQYFAIGDWESPVHFANLVVQSLPGS